MYLALYNRSEDNALLVGEGGEMLFAYDVMYLVGFSLVLTMPQVAFKYRREHLDQVCFEESSYSL